MRFTVSLPKRQISLSLPPGISADGLILSQQPDNPVEVVVLSASRQPTKQELVKVWKERLGGRATPLLLVTQLLGKVTICGPSGDTPTIFENIGVEIAERLVEEVLAYPTRTSAQHFLYDSLPTLETSLSGIINEGMLSSHDLSTTAKTLNEWPTATQKSKQALKKRGHELLKELGYTIEKLDNVTNILRSDDRKTALAILLEQHEGIENTSPRFNSFSPISYAMSKAHENSLAWIIIVRGENVRLYSTQIGKGVGRRGRIETYLECRPSLLSKDNLGYIWLLFSADALTLNGTLEKLFKSSERYAGDLASSLRSRIYDEVVPNLVSGIVNARSLNNYDREQLDITYQMAIVILFRLLFIAYAEDRDLLPYRLNDTYRCNSLTEKAKELATAIYNQEEIENGSSCWEECKTLFKAVNEGNPEWSVPEYGGVLFSDEKEISSAGFLLSTIDLENKYFEKALRSLLVMWGGARRLGLLTFGH